jgi:ElaB/YqjD/DUF883 family membrane-anchored ribosome-binding protein
VTHVRLRPWHGLAIGVAIVVIGALLSMLVGFHGIPHSK